MHGEDRVLEGGEPKPAGLGRLRSLLRWPFRSVPSRIVASVFAAALVTSLGVTWMSTRSIDSFLRSKMDQRFPSTLRNTSDRLELWYSQRELDLETFAASQTLAEGLADLRRRGRGGEVEKELASYLGVVLESFFQYEALFVLAPDGEVLLRVGKAFALPPEHRRRLAGVTSSRIDDLPGVQGRHLQIASASIRDGRRRQLASLHAVVRLGVLEEVLENDTLGDDGGIYLLGPEGDVLLTSPGAPDFGAHAHRLPPSGAPPETYDSVHDDGSRVVGSALGFPRFGWTIVVEQAYGQAFAPIVAASREVLGVNLAIVLVFCLIAFQMARSIVRPIQALSDAAVRIGRGELDVVIAGVASDDEIGVLTGTFNEMSSRLRENQRKLEDQRLEIENANSRLVAQNQELQRMNEVFQQLSVTDELTRLHNHRFFRDHLPLEVKRCERTNEPLCLVMIDLDDFKQLNDRYGHAVGDAVLRKVADVMTASIRDMDLLARYGGEEFALLASQTPLEGAVALAEKIRSAISRARFSVVDLDGPSEIQVTASFGVARYRGDEKAFFNDADRALYRAKAEGKDCVVAAEEGG